MRVLIVFFLIFGNKCFCQKINVEDSSINNNINFEVVYISPKLIDLENNIIEPSKYVIDLNLSKDQKEYLNKLGYEDLLSLLENEKSDFGMNLVLYFLFEKEVLFTEEKKDRESWLKYDKREDLNHWREFLKSHFYDIPEKLNKIPDD